MTKSTKIQERIDGDIHAVRKRLRDQHRESRDQIIAGLNFGFWASLLHGDHEQLWRDSLRKAFPHSSGKRSDVAAVVEPLRLFRNRLAHHDSLLAVDVIFKRDQILQLIEWIDRDAAIWLKRCERVTEVYADRPTVAPDTVVVAARNAWALYETTQAYVCQAGRSFQPTTYLAFYQERVIRRQVPKILGRQDNVSWTPADSQRLQNSPEPSDRRLGKIISESIVEGWTDGRYQVFFLTKEGDSGHITLPDDIPHVSVGRGSAYTQRQRYISHQRLYGATSTDQLSP